MIRHVASIMLLLAASSPASRERIQAARSEPAAPPQAEISAVFARPLENAPEVRRVATLLERAFALAAPATLPTRPRPAFDPRDLVAPRPKADAEPVPIFIIPSGELLARVLSAAAEADVEPIRGAEFRSLCCRWFDPRNCPELPAQFLPAPEVLKDEPRPSADFHRVVGPRPALDRLDLQIPHAGERAVVLDSSTMADTLLLWHISAVSYGHIDGRAAERRFDHIALVLAEAAGPPDHGADPGPRRHGAYECTVTAPDGSKIAGTSFPFLAPDPLRWKRADGRLTPRERLVIPLDLIERMGGVVMVRRGPAWRPDREDLVLDARPNLERLHAVLVSTSIFDEEAVSLACTLTGPPANVPIRPQALIAK